MARQQLSNFNGHLWRQPRKCILDRLFRCALGCKLYEDEGC